MKLIYIVDDDYDTVHSISHWLKNKRFAVKGFSNSKALFEGIDTEIPDIILLDVLLGPEDGRLISKEIRKRYITNIPVILFSAAFSSIKNLEEVGAADFIRKDITLREVTELLQQHIRLEEE